jgi:hypothetical protein
MSIFAKTEKKGDYATALNEMADAIAKAADLAPDLRALGWRLEEAAASLHRRWAVTAPHPSVTRSATRIG